MRVSATAAALAIVLLFACPALAQQVIHVDQIHGRDDNSGLTWPGTRTIQRGIQRAQEHGLHEVWVAVPDPYYKECVTIQNYRIELYGGFLGGEALREQRDPVNNVTTIRGYRTDPPFNDPYDCPVISILNADNSVVDGFTITGGGGTNMTRYGGGFYIMDSDCWIWNNIVTDNGSFHGGGMYVQDSAIWLKNNNFNGNIGYMEGGGIHAVRSHFVPKMELNTFDGNVGTERGGGVLMVDNCDGWLKDNKWQNNTAAYGGGIAFYQLSAPLTELNEFSGNGAPTRGGGIYCNGSSPTIRENTISGNTIGSTGRGGGIAVSSCGPLIERNRITQNEVADSEGGKGGGISLETGTSTIAGNIIDYNKVYESGGGIEIDVSSNAVVTNNTIAWNDAYRLITPPPDPTCAGRGGGIHVDGGSRLTVRNTIFYNNWPDDICCDGNSTVDRDYNCYHLSRTEDCVPLPCLCDNCTCIMGTHELGCDPEFLDGDYHLGPRSCCIDKGLNTASGIPGKDYVDGESRVLDGGDDGTATVDIGADELWSAVTSIGSAKGAEEGRPVDLRGGIAVTVAWPDYYYVEDTDRVMGMRCYEPGHSYGPGDPLPVYGKVRTNTDDERYIEVIRSGPATEEKLYLRPLSMNNHALGGGRFPSTGANYQKGVWSWNNKKDEPPWASARGLNNIGLLVSVWGNVTYVNQVPGHPEQEFFYVDDGSRRVDGTLHGGGTQPLQPNFGIRCVLLNNQPLPPLLEVGQIVTLTGVSSCFKPGTDPVRILRIMDIPGIIRP